MSTNENDQLFERAVEMMYYFEGKLPAQVIEADIERSDLEALESHVIYAEAMAAQQEMEAVDIV